MKVLPRARALSPRDPRRDARRHRARSCAHGGRRARAAATFYLSPRADIRSTDASARCAAPSSVWRRSRRIYLSGVSYDPFVRGGFRCSIESCGSTVRMADDVEDARGDSPGSYEPVARRVARRAHESFTRRRSVRRRRGPARERFRRSSSSIRSCSRKPRALVRAALPLMMTVAHPRARRCALPSRAASGRHPQFPFVDDIVSYQARFLAKRRSRTRLTQHASAA